MEITVLGEGQSEVDLKDPRNCSRRRSGVLHFCRSFISVIDAPDVDREILRDGAGSKDGD